MSDIPEQFLQPYNPADHEDNIYELWEQSGYFNPDTCIKDSVTNKDAEHFSIVLPPPNVTGTLHSGHAMMLAIEDTMVRFQRMLGKKTVWIPGTDHAAISTEAVIVKQLAKEKTTKFKIGREAFMERVNAFAQESQDTIINQTKKMGASLDWSRLAFTLDEQRQHAVYTAFKQMYGDGLIYRGDRIVNWDPKGQTTVSDDEVVHEEREAEMYYFKYSHDFPFVIATTRPETKLGDTAVAVHPDDKRYQEYIGKEFSCTFAGHDITIKVIADEHVDPELGTGALGVTPAHSQTDWEIAQRHDLPSIQVINEYAKMTVGMEGVKNKKTTEARTAIVQWLEQEKLLEKIETIQQNISLSQRTKAPIEPLPKKQWWIDVNKKVDGKSLKERMLEVVRNGEIDILPERFEKIYFNWIENLRDWNISRQIWYGHRVPVWYKEDKLVVAQDSPGEGWEQDTDTLDTWFSSGLWTFSTLGWPNETSDLQTFHPTSVLETGHDIIFFWVARMILMSTYLLGEIPFKTVYMHGMVLDKHGKKMSKSNPETAVDPLDAIQEYGADALRMAMIVGVGPGQDVSLGDEKIRAYKKFGNKLWNVTRFILENTQGTRYVQDFTDFTKDDQKLLAARDVLVQEITKEMLDYKFYLVGEKLYHYVWHEIADNVLEDSKNIFTEGIEQEITSRKQLLLHILHTSLRALHPFMPFLTETIWQSLPDDIRQNNQPLMVHQWPKSVKKK